MFFKWANLAMRLYPDLEVKTCHSYIINFKHNWDCKTCGRAYAFGSRTSCRPRPPECPISSYGRHSNSIKPTDRCSCGGALAYRTKTKADGTPRKAPAPNSFTLFVRDNFARVKAAHPGASHSQLMQKISEEYAKQKGRPQP